MNTEIIEETTQEIKMVRAIVESEKQGSFYLVEISINLSTYITEEEDCTCPEYKKTKKTCGHIKEIVAQSVR